MTRLALVLLAACATEPDGVDVLSDSTLSFTPAQTTLKRTPPRCGDTTGTYSDSDLFTLTLVGPPDGNGLTTMIGVAFHRTLPLGVSLPVDLGPFGIVIEEDVYGQNGTLPLQGNTFAYEQGADPSELEPGPIGNAVVRIDKVPTDDGDTGILTIRLQFMASRVYDVQITAPASSCPGS